MKGFINLATQAKLFWSFGLMVTLLAVVIVMGHSGVTTIQEAQKNLYEQDFAIAVTLKELRANQNGVRAALLTMVTTEKPSDRAAAQQDIKEREQESDELMQRIVDLGKGDPEISSRIEEFRSIRIAFRDLRDKEIVPLIQQGKMEEAKQLIFGTQAERNEKMRAIADELVKQADDKAAAAVTASAQRARDTMLVFVSVGAIALLLGVAMTLFLTRIIAGPLREIAVIAERVASGDLTVNVPTDSRADEVGTLARAFRAMIENLRQTTREINEGVGVLASSSSEILATTTQVAAGAAETATAVSETTATVEEVKQTAQLASQKAKYVSDSAHKVAQVSQTGRKAVEDAIAGMQRIQEQMESIAESIVRLSEQSQAIGEIIATVNDLAEQSNLLAVNAAIEATRAGEQGKGFAVVAQEVKSLAEQSKQATAQVRTILGDIQKATGAAVLATEQGSKAVEAGVRQTGDTGESIRLLAESINEAAQAATQIAASSQQQMVGMDQVALAMDNIKQASTQNVAGTRQAETAAQQLHELGQRLKQLTDRYRL